jgi:hypothetical protein
LDIFLWLFNFFHQRVDGMWCSNMVCDILLWVLVGACDISLRPKMSFCHVIGSAVLLSSSWSDVWCCLANDLSLMVISLFFFLLFSLSYQKCTSILSFFFAILVLRFFIIYLVLDSFGKVFYVFNFIIELQFFMYYFLRFGFYSFDFWFFFLVLLLKFYCF